MTKTEAEIQKVLEQTVKEVLADCITHGYNDANEGLKEPTHYCKAFFNTQMDIIAQALHRVVEVERERTIIHLTDYLKKLIWSDRDIKYMLESLSHSEDKGEDPYHEHITSKTSHTICIKCGKDLIKPIYAK